MPTDPPHSRPQDAMVLRELDGLRCDVAGLRTDMKEQRVENGARFAESIAEARRTNGRLRRVELWSFAMRVVGSLLVTLIPFVLFLLNRTV